MRTVTIFYAWQSDTPQRFNRYLIRIALEAAAKRINQDPGLAVVVLVDADTEGVPGQPPITQTILDKIANCDIFVPDLTFVARTEGGKPIPNPNVLTEYGYAIRARTYSAIMPIMNTAFGLPEKLPFDMAHLRYPIQYSIPPNAKDSERRKARDALALEIERVLRLQIAATKPPPVPFPKADSRDGPARFRPPTAPLGRRWSDPPDPFNPFEQEVLSAPGPAVWLRLMPTVDPGKRWSFHELRNSNLVCLTPIYPHSLHGQHLIRAEDGLAVCYLNLPDAPRTDSFVFVFETGEVWSVDTIFLARAPGRIVSFEYRWIECFSNYAKYLSSLDIKPPYQWIGGLTGVKDRRIVVPPEPGSRIRGGSLGRQCTADTISSEGIYDGKQTETNALYPLFKMIFEKCGTERPAYLDQTVT